MVVAAPKVHPIARRDVHEEVASAMDSIRSIVHALRVSSREIEQKLGISSAQLYVLQELNDSPALSINELAERTFTHQSSVSMVVARLVDSRLVTRTASRADGRRLAVSLTPAGRAILRRSPATAQTRLINALREMAPSALHGLATGLDTLIGHMAD
jgi:MarR family transcriptional regulator, lower aerobic nicotinate degradation pathway regulator